MRRASVDDVQHLVGLMAEFYAEAGYPLNHRRAAEAFTTGAGLATAALVEVREFCAGRVVRAIHLEVARDNTPAQMVYRRVGFESTDRQLLTLRLADPTHEG
jgi:RimJ/RimL family protein N-acetyltransferase